jgi:transcriptional regulator with XRE-family HTH domain
VINVRDGKLLKRFGKHLRTTRKDASITQEELANGADIPLSQIGRIERGEINATLSTLNALAAALKIPLHKLMNF